MVMMLIVTMLLVRVIAFIARVVIITGHLYIPSCKSSDSFSDGFDDDDDNSDDDNVNDDNSDDNKW